MPANHAVMRMSFVSSSDLQFKNHWLVTGVFNQSYPKWCYVEFSAPAGYTADLYQVLKISRHTFSWLDFAVVT